MASILRYLFLLSSFALHAQDFGKHGTTFAIQEQNIIEYLKDRLQNASPQEKERISQKLIKIGKEPRQVDIPIAKRYRCSLYDPSITAQADIKDHKGVMIVKRGTKYNPLENFSLNTPLLFIDSTDESQIAWAKANEGKWVLVRGKPLDLEESEGIPVYFDQFGYLTKKLDIRSTPAKVTQEGLFLKVEEIPLEIS